MPRQIIIGTIIKDCIKLWLILNLLCFLQNNEAIVNMNRPVITKIKAKKALMMKPIDLIIVVNFKFWFEYL